MEPKGRKNIETTIPPTPLIRGAVLDVVRLVAGLVPGAACCRCPGRDPRPLVQIVKIVLGKCYSHKLS